jgi:hypothetical protein
MQITDLVINEMIRFIKRYPEYVLDKVGTIISVNVEDGIVLVRTESKTIYKLIFKDTEFFVLQSEINICKINNINV